MCVMCLLAVPIKNVAVCLGLKPAVCSFQTESSVPSAEPSDGWRSRCSADSHTSEPAGSAAASGPNETQTAAGAPATEAPPGMGLGSEVSTWQVLSSYEE